MFTPIYRVRFFLYFYPLLLGQIFFLHFCPFLLGQIFSIFYPFLLGQSELINLDFFDPTKRGKILTFFTKHHMCVRLLFTNHPKLLSFQTLILASPFFPWELFLQQLLSFLHPSGHTFFASKATDPTQNVLFFPRHSLFFFM